MSGEIADRRSLRVFLVEDEYSLRIPLAKYLERECGYQVTEAAHAEGAWDILSNSGQPFDVAIVDDLLAPSENEEPKYLGIDLLREIKDRWTETEVIIFTGWGMERALEALRAGAYRYLEKPVEPEELGLTIRMAAEQARLRTERDFLSAALEISNAMVGAANAEKVLEFITAAIPQLTGADACIVARIDTSTGEIRHAPTNLLGDKSIIWTRHLRQKPLTQRIVESGEAFLLRDAKTGAGELDERLCESGVRSFVAVPIPAEDHNLGALYAYSLRPNAFGPQEQRLVTLLAQQAGIALENARLFKATRQASKQLSALNQVVLEIEKPLDRLTLLRTIMEQAVSLLSAEGGGVYLLDPSGEYLVSAVSAGLQVDLESYQIGREEGLTGRILKAGKPQRVGDYHRWDERLGVLDGHKLIDVAGAPIEVEGQVLGTLIVHTTQPGRRFDEDALALLQQFANHAALALQKTDLISRLTRTREELDALIARSFDAVVAIDQEKRITIFNEQAEEMFGYQAEGMLGQTVEALYVDREKAREIFDVVNREGEIIGWKVDLKCSDDTAIPALVSAVLIRDGRGKLIGQAGFIRDLRTVKLLEGRLRAVVEMTKAITGTLELSEALDLIAQCAVAAFPKADSGAIHLYNERKDFLRIGASAIPYSPEAIEALGLSVREGIAGWVFRNQQPLLVPDAERDPRYKLVDHPEVQVDKSMLCVPLRIKDQVIGTLSVNNKEITDAFQPGDLGLLSSFADQAAIVIDNARQMERLEQVSQAAEDMARALEPEQLLLRVAESAREVLQANCAVVWSYNEVRDQFASGELIAAGIPPEELDRLEQEMPRSDLMAHLVMRRGYVAVKDVLRAKYDLLGQPFRDLLDRISVRSFQGTALRAGDERIGVLCVGYDHIRGFDEGEEAALKMLAGHAALAIKNTRLLGQMQRTGKATKVIASVTVQEDLAQTVKVVARSVGDVLSSDAVAIYSYNEDTQDLGEWVVVNPDARDSNSARHPEDLTEESAVWRILEIDTPPYYHMVEDGVCQDEMLGGYFTCAEGLRSAIGIQLRVGGRRVGVLFVNFRSSHHFTDDELTNINLFAHQAAVAIRNAQLYEETRRRATALGSLYEAGKAMTSTLALDDILHRIAEQAWQLTGHCGKDKRARFSHIALKKGNRVKFEAAYPREHLPGLQRGVGDIDLDHDDRVGITGRAAKTGQSQLVSDVTLDPDYIQYDPGTRSELAVPLKIGEEVIGVINVEHPDPGVFDEEDQRNLRALAAQAATAIQNAYLYQGKQRRVRELAGLNRISQSICSLTNIDEVYQQVNKSIAELVDAEMCAVLLYEEKENALVCQLPMYGVPDEIGLSYRIPVDPNSPAGVVWAAHDYLVINNVRQHPLVDEIGLQNLAEEAGLRDTLLVKLVSGNQRIGVIQASNKRSGDPFSEDDARLLSIFAGQAAAVIENAKLYEEMRQMYEELKEAKGLIAGRTALAWMGMASSAWRHTIDKHALTIREQLQLLKQDLAPMLSPPEGPRVEGRMAMIERLFTQILEKPITPPLSTESGLEWVSLSTLVGERARQLWQRAPYEEVKLGLVLQLPESAVVQASSEWLRRAFDMLVDNAVKAVASREVQEITVGTRAANGGAEILITDTGPGIPEDIQDKIGLERIEKPRDAEGLGMGLLMAQVIAQTYGGDIRVGSTGPTGTTMVIWLPLDR